MRSTQTHMKKLFLFFIAFIYMTALKAQGVEFGVSGSFGYGSLYPKLFPAQDPGSYILWENRKLVASSAQISGFIDAKLTRKKSIRPGIQFFYIKNRTDWNYVQTNGKVNRGEASSTLYELSFPIQYVYSYKNWLFKIGPQIGYVLTYIGKSKEWNENDEITYNGQRSSRPYTLDLGYTLGAEYRISRKMNVMFRYYQGLRDMLIIKPITGNNILNYPISVQIGLSYTFRKKPKPHSDHF